MSPKTSRNSISIILSLSLGLGSAACTVESGPSEFADDTASTGTTTDVEERSGDLDLPRPNTFEDPWMFDQPLDVETYFDPTSFEPENEPLAYAPQKIFERETVAFGDRMWERTAPNRFELAGSAGSISFEYTDDFRKVQFKRGNHRIPLSFAGTPIERRVKAGFIAVLGMSGIHPSEEVNDVAAVTGVEVIGGILVVLGAVVISCALLIQNCTVSASYACDPLSAQVTAPCTITSGPNGSSVNFGCSWTCTGGGSGSGSGGSSASGPSSVTESASDDGATASASDDGATASASDSNADDGDGDGDGGNDSGGAADDCGGEGGGNSVHIGSFPGGNGTIVDYASADGDNGGDDDAGGGGDSTGC